jgi:hypothetical protein
MQPEIVKVVLHRTVMMHAPETCKFSIFSAAGMVSALRACGLSPPFRVAFLVEGQAGYFFFAALRVLRMLR